MSKKPTQPERQTVTLPEPMTLADLKYPEYKPRGRTERVLHTFTMYHVAGRGWVICTLHISNASRRSVHQTARSYGIQMDGSICTVGSGPHVTAEVTVYVRESRVAALQKFLDLKQKGETEAGIIRDRISTRRANTVLRRGVRSNPFDFLNQPWDS